MNLCWEVDIPETDASACSVTAGDEDADGLHFCTRMLPRLTTNGAHDGPHRCNCGHAWGQDLPRHAVE